MEVDGRVKSSTIDHHVSASKRAQLLLKFYSLLDNKLNKSLLWEVQWSVSVTDANDDWFPQKIRRSSEFGDEANNYYRKDEEKSRN
jgi:hypothetical protein